MLQQSTYTAQAQSGSWVDASSYVGGDYGNEPPAKVYRPLQYFYPEWHALAACLDNPDEKDVFFNSSDDNNYTHTDAYRAKQICSTCPVFNECLRHAVTVREEYGFWAGTTMRQRKTLFKRISTGELTEEEAIQGLMR